MKRLNRSLFQRLYLGATTLCLLLFGPLNVRALAVDSVCSPDMSALDCSALEGNWANWVPDIPNASGTSCVSGSLTGSDNKQKAYNYFVSKSLSPVTSAAIVGNFAQESNVNPSDGGGYMAQWGGGRLDNLNAFAQHEGKPVTDLGVQLDFVATELRILPVPSGLTAGDYSSTLSSTKAQTDISDATGYFMGTYPLGNPYGGIPGGQADPATVAFVNKNGSHPGYEGPGIPRLDNRINDAVGILKLYGGSQATGAISSLSSGCSGTGGGSAVGGSGFIGDAPAGALQGDQCVDYVKWVLSQHFTPYNGQQLAMGNGNQIAPNIHARFPSIVLHHTPAVHSVVSFTAPYGTSSVYGHVAMVSQVNVSGGHVTSIVVEEYNFTYENPGKYDKRTITDQAVISNGTYAHTEVDWK